MIELGETCHLKKLELILFYLFSFGMVFCHTSMKDYYCIQWYNFLPYAVAVIILTTLESVVKNIRQKLHIDLSFVATEQFIDVKYSNDGIRPSDNNMILSAKH